MSLHLLVQAIDNAPHHVYEWLQSGFAVYTLEVRAAIQSNLDRLDEWTNRHVVKFNKDKCSRTCYFPETIQTEADWLGSSSVNKLLEVLGNNRLHMNKECTPEVMKANSILGPINRNIASRSSEVIPLYLALIRLHLEYCICFWCPRMRKNAEKLDWAQQRTMKHHRSWSACLPSEERLRDWGLFGLEKRQLWSRGV